MISRYRMFRCFFFVAKKVEKTAVAAAWRWPWTGQASNNAGKSVWSTSSVIVALVKLFLAVLVLLCAVITLFASIFLRLLGLYVPCSCLVHHLKGRFETARNMLNTRISAGEKSGFGDRDADLHTGEATVGSDFCYSRPCAHLQEILPADRVCIWKESGESGSRQTPMEIFNAGEAADGDAHQVHAEQSWDEYREPKVDVALQSEREALAAMYQELEQERNASSTAANEAMGMIARLQEEKAVVLMEARQFQRMAEEKSKHDQEAIEALLGVVAKREEEKSELEEEIQFYRLKLLRAQVEEEISARRIENQMLLLTGPSAEGRNLAKLISSTTTRKETTAVCAGAANARAVDAKRLRFTERGIRPKNHIRGPILTEVSHKPRTPHADDSSSLPGAKFMSLKRRSSSHCYAAPESVNEDGGFTQDLSHRALAESRLSVLGCLWKLEEEMPQHGEKQNVLNRKTNTVDVSSCKTQSPVEKTMSLEKAMRSLQTMISTMNGDDGLWQGCYEDGNTNERTSDPSSSVEVDANVTPGQHSQADEDENKQEEQEAGTFMISGEGTVVQSGDEEVLFEHDVYEVQESCHKLQGIAGEQNRWRHQPNVDRLGKSEHLFFHDEDIRDGDELEYAGGDFTMPLYEAGNSGTGTQWEELYCRAREGDVSTNSKGRRHQSWTSLADDVQQLNLRLKALEADRNLIKQTIDSLTRENGEMKLLQEIVEQLRELRGIKWNGLQQQGSFPDLLSFQVL